MLLLVARGIRYAVQDTCYDVLAEYAATDRNRDNVGSGCDCRRPEKMPVHIPLQPIVQTMVMSEHDCHICSVISASHRQPSTYL
jgi:hypothetical protein